MLQKLKNEKKENCDLFGRFGDSYWRRRLVPYPGDFQIMRESWHICDWLQFMKIIIISNGNGTKWSPIQLL